MRAAFASALALALAGCAEERVDMPGAQDRSSEVPASVAAETETGTETATTSSAATAPGDASDVPHIYMALQPDSAGPTSVILAIDRSGDTTPSDDPAIRLTPVNGQCNPQQLRWYEFPPEQARRPAYGPEQAAGGVSARDLPGFMAMAVTAAMLEAGLIDDPEESHAQNVCTRKLLQRMMIDTSSARAS